VQVHVEVKGTQGDNVCFIITAAEVRNAMFDRKHQTGVVTAALTATPKMFTYAEDDFPGKFKRNRLRSEYNCYQTEDLLLRS
jgi:hypothetical protein